MRQKQNQKVQTMKTFKDILNEVAEPKGGDEKRFKAKHVIKKIGHPIDDDAEETQFKGRTKKDTSKKASYHDGEDERVYEECGKTVDKDGSNIKKFVKKAKSMTRTRGDAEVNDDIADNVTEAAQKTWRVEHKDGVATVKAHNENQARSRGLSKIGIRKSEHNSAFHRKHTKSVKQVDENTQLDELSKKTLGSYIKKASDDKAVKMSSISNAHTDSETRKKHLKKYVKRAGGLQKAVDKLTKEEFINEAVKAGSMKLSDGSRVKLTKEDAEAMNDLFGELNSTNKKRMEEEMMASKDGFEKILNFAREASE